MPVVYDSTKRRVVDVIMEAKAFKVCLNETEDYNEKML